jgi:asparagine synthase (glutamine-hydrolysing)
MCGFAGEIAGDAAADTAVAERMAECLAPRGPDGDGSWMSGRVALAHRRLQVIDLSETGAQPMVDEELGLAVVFNGCIYNYRHLRAELEGAGHRFFSQSDTEVLLKGYREWGPGFVERLVGMFAFCLVEADSGRALLGRDRLGIKPLYTAERPGGGLRFASTPQALIAGGGVDTSIDPIALHHYLTWHAVVPAPRTVLAGVRKIEPATVMTVEPDGSRSTTRYWEPRFERDPDKADWDARDWEDAVLEALRVAVERRMVSDVPVGVLLSGGLDSSLIVALLAERGQRGLRTFSVAFEEAGGREGNELPWAEKVAEQFDSDHLSFQVGHERMFPALDSAIAAMSEPMVSHDNVAFHLLCGAVSQHLKVVQSGQGADEVFAGYHWYQTVADADGDAFAAYREAFFDGGHDDVASIVSPELLPKEDPSEAFAVDHFARPGADEGVDRALRLDTEVMLVDDPVKRLDNMSMAWGLEARVPFLDHELVELAAACPPELKLSRGGKGIVKGVGHRLLPADVVDRPKGYFPVPAVSHIEGPVLELVRDALTTQAARDRGLFRPERVEGLLADPNGQMTPLDGNRLWQLALLELWLQRLPSG